MFMVYFQTKFFGKVVIYIYIYIYVCMYVYMYVCMYVSVPLEMLRCTKLFSRVKA